MSEFKVKTRNKIEKSPTIKTKIRQDRNQFEDVINSIKAFIDLKNDILKPVGPIRYVAPEIKLESKDLTTLTQLLCDLQNTVLKKLNIKFCIGIKSSILHGSDIIITCDYFQLAYHIVYDKLKG